MPIKIGEQSFLKFKDAVRFIMRTKNLTKARASAYVATIERKQKKVRYP